jgi:hypothetical protein
MSNIQGQNVPQGTADVNVTSAPIPQAQPVPIQGQYVPQGTATVDVTSAPIPQAQPVPQTTTVIVKERDSASERRETIRILAWVFFGLGFIFPYLWYAGIYFVTRKDRSARIAGIASIILLSVYVAVTVVIIVVIYATAVAIASTTYP